MLLVSVCALVLGQAGVRAQGQTPVFGSSVTLTRLKVAVLDGSGAPVGGLGRADFRVVEDGVDQDLQVVLAPEAAPLEVALVLDFSGSIAEDWPQARDQVRVFLDALSSEDCVYLLPFNSQVGPGLWAHPQAATVRSLISRYPMTGRTRLYDAIDEALERLQGAGILPASSCGAGRQGEGERRRALVLLTDGMDEGSRFSYSDILLSTWQADIPAFPVAVGVAAMSSRELRGLRDHFFAEDLVREIATFQGQLRELARVSGGRFVSERDMHAAYVQVLALLRSYYVLGYRSEEQQREGWHSVEVSLVGRDEQVLVQPGFYRSAVDVGSAWSALGTARTAFEARRFHDAARWFDLAAGISPAVGMPFFGHGLALEALGSLRLARDAYERSLHQNPGMPTTHARLAVVCQRLVDLVCAWEHALRAGAGGADVRELMDSLRRRGAAPEEVQGLETAPVLYVLPPDVPELSAQLILRDFTRRLGVLVEESLESALTRWYQHAEYYLVLRPDGIDQGPPRSAEVRVELYDIRRNRLWDRNIKLGNLDDSIQTTAELNRTVRDLRARLARMGR